MSIFSTSHKSVSSHVETSPHIDEQLDQHLDAYDPQRHPEIKDALLDEAVMLVTTAKRWGGTTPALTAHLRQLGTCARQLYDAPASRAAQWIALEASFNQLPPGLRQTAGHLRDCEREQRETRRLQQALDGMPMSRPLKYSRYDMNNVRERLEGAQLRLDAAAKDVAAGHFNGMSDHMATIRGRLAGVREFLIHNDAIKRPEPGAGETPQRPGQRPPSGATPGGPSSKKFSPASCLRGGLSQVARDCAHQLKKAQRAVVHHLSPSQIHQAKELARNRREMALAPARAEFHQLQSDLDLVELRMGTMRSLTGKLAPALQGLFQHTLTPMLQEARNARASAEKALSPRTPSVQVAEQGIAVLRSRLEGIVNALAHANQTPPSLKLFERPWTPSAVPAR